MAATKSFEDGLIKVEKKLEECFTRIIKVEECVAQMHQEFSLWSDKLLKSVEATEKKEQIDTGNGKRKEESGASSPFIRGTAYLPLYPVNRPEKKVKNAFRMKMSNTIIKDLLARCLVIKEIIDASTMHIDSIRNDKAEEETSAKEAKESSYEGADNIIGKENGSKKAALPFEVPTLGVVAYGVVPWTQKEVPTVTNTAVTNIAVTNELGVVAYEVVAWTQRGVPTVTNIAVTNEEVSSSKGGVLL
uniref:Uncharacterized protein n=1 Tax=Tanacetum cinerariifolium TaxID=118510 RepID=A0A6L2JQ11_TANCI|nr:hypothetical protein [Tanacetum cinerariifolium]